MIIEEAEAKLRAIEGDATINTRQAALTALRDLGIDDFGYVLMTMPNADFPRLSGLLPRMASDEVQKNWTGNCGEALLRQTCAFVRSVAYNYSRFVGRPLDGAKILDFGCGYGRIARVMYYFSDLSKIFGVDPWDRSLDICRQDGLGANFLQSSYLPTSLPVLESNFDLIYAFSVFTHLSERATRMCLAVLSKYLKPGGLLAITIRPVQYWHHDVSAQKAGLVERQIALHKEKGFAFLPHDRAPVDDDITYGDTSFTTDWLRTNFPQLSIKGVDRSLEDPFQYYVFLQHDSEID